MSLKGAVCKIWATVKFFVSIVFNVYAVLGVVLYLSATAIYDKYTETQYPLKSSTPKDAVVLLNLTSGEINETSVYGTPASRWANLFVNSRSNRFSFSEQVYALKQAATDEKVKGVAVTIAARQWNGAQAYEISEALLEVRNAGKPVYVFIQGSATNYDLLIASAATKRYVSPGTFVRPVRPIYGAVFNKGFYDKFKIDFVGQRVSLYKDLILDDVKYQVDQDVKSTYDSFYQIYLDTIKTVAANYDKQVTDFDLSDEALLKLFKEYKGNFAQAFTDQGWFDGVVTKADFDSLVAEEVQGNARNKKLPNYFSLASYASAIENPLFDLNASRNKDHIAYVALVGDVVSRGTAPDVISINNTLRYLRAIYYNANNVKALVLRIDSPGGSASTGVTIRQAIDDIRAKGIPVVVSQGYLAASAGYMLSSGSDYIYASPTTITGSIGVVITGYNVNRFIEQFDIHADAQGYGKQFATGFRIPYFVAGWANPYGDQVKNLWKAGITNSYHHFISQVYEGRKSHFDSLEAVHRVSQGHIWGGTDAKTLGLVDGFGSVPEAVNKARELIVLYQNEREEDKFSRGTLNEVKVEDIDKLPVVYYNAGRRYSITGDTLTTRVLNTFDVVTGGYFSSVVNLVNNLIAPEDQVFGTYQARVDDSLISPNQGQ
ncbi:hypothetical protein CJP74_02495 [Psittacicella melopsittaci]|uniref:Peptidase S49 domain-containing protein n=1 Tax=Psittacicella melopsittaci TaxID=2028576 RepID=A0A3A1YAW0_9GAMM|nr:S49 family peptidase [Psittacicella melopsittaci]RIY33314.1 hypothetical protein CJP74_02495 [Psittacicella melopsittaci]